jgi:hypothetical protein
MSTTNQYRRVAWDYLKLAATISNPNEYFWAEFGPMGEASGRLRGSDAQA